MSTDIDVNKASNNTNNTGRYDIENDERLYFLQESYVRQTNAYARMSDDKLEAVLQSLRAIAGDDSLIELALEWKDKIFAPRGIFDDIESHGFVIPCRAPLMPVVVLFSGVDALRRFYAERDIPESMLIDILYDTSRNMDEAFAKNGNYNIESGLIGWQTRHYTGRLFQLGRLQYEAMLIKRDNRLLQKGDYVINTHIPSGGKLPHEEVRDSYRRAAAFFARLMPDIPFKGFVCESWMLSPQLREMLDERSNLVRFQSDYELYGTEEDESFYSYVFIKKPGDLRALQEDTALRRAIKARLLAGGKIMSGRGFFPLDKAL